MALKITIKHDDTSNSHPVRVQAWAGKIPTFDSELQRREALRKASGETDTTGTQAGTPVGLASKEQLGSKDYNTSGVDTEAAKKKGGQKKEAVKQSGYDFDKMSQKERVAFAEANKIDLSDIDVEDPEEEVLLVTKLQDWAKAQPVPENPDTAKDAAQAKAKAQIETQEKIAQERSADQTVFTEGTILQEHTLSPGETKTFEIGNNDFLTIKEDK